jgi:hypothetical protein
VFSRFFGTANPYEALNGRFLQLATGWASLAAATAELAFLQGWQPQCTYWITLSPQWIVGFFSGSPVQQHLS